MELSPRWLAAGVNEAQVNVVYGPTKAGIHYRYTHTATDKKIQLPITGDIKEGTVRILLPPGVSRAKMYSNDKSLPAFTETINKSTYIVLRDNELKNKTFVIRY